MSPFDVPSREKSGVYEWSFVPLHQKQRKRSRTDQDGHSLQRHESGAKEVELDREEVIRRLRLLQQPVTLFGEVGLSNNSHRSKASMIYIIAV